MMLSSEYLVQIFGNGGKKRKIKKPTSKKPKNLKETIKQKNNKESYLTSNNNKESEAISNFKKKYNPVASITYSTVPPSDQKIRLDTGPSTQFNSWVRRPNAEKRTSVTENIDHPINASAPPLDINSTQRQSAKNKGLRLAARKRLFLNNYGNDIKTGAWWGLALGSGIGTGLGVYRVFDALPKNTMQENPEADFIQEDVVNTPAKSNNTTQERTPSNNQTVPTQSESTQANAPKPSTSNTSRTAQANTSNRNTQTASSKQSQKKQKSQSRNTSNKNTNTTSKKKLISKTQAKKAFANEFMKAYQNAAIDVDNSSTRDYYSEALDLKSQLDKQRKDEVAKLQQQVQSLQNQLNQLTNPIY